MPPLEPWYKVVTPRKEVREGRSFSPDEFAIALEQVVAGNAPADYGNPDKFFVRTCFTRALAAHIGLVLRRLAGETQNTAPVLALITQFGGGKTHTLTALYHLIQNAGKIEHSERIRALLNLINLENIPNAKVAVFVGNAWDPVEGKEMPWIDIARQLAGDAGVSALGPEAKTKAPGTDNIRKLFEAAGGRVLVLCDEVLNFLSRHRDRAESFRDFLGNLVRAMTGTTGCAAMVSLPQSKPEMSEWDLRWQEIITKEVGRVAKQLIANDEAEISEVVCRRLFENLGPERTRKTVSKTYADWCFERRAQLPPEWTAVDTATTETKAKEFLRTRFEACYPFHPSTLLVFQRKWATLPQYQQTRGTLAMLAQWVSLAYREGYQSARREPLISLGSAPLEASVFRAVILGQLGDPKLLPAIEADISGMHSHARVLDADTKGALKDIHRRVATAILFESSGGQVDKVAHLPELRFALGEPEIDTTSIDNAASALESKSFFIRKIGSDGFQIRHQPTLKKVVSDRRASLDYETEIRPAMRSLVQKEFEKGSSIPLVFFPEDSSAIQDSPRLTLIIAGPESEWMGGGSLRVPFYPPAYLQKSPEPESMEPGSLRGQIADWTKQRGKSPRLYPGALVWCLKRPGRDLRDKVELWLAWKRVGREIADGTLGADFDRGEKAEIQAKISDAEESVKDEIWGGYRFVVLADGREPDGLKTIDLGAGHASSGETLGMRVIMALKSQALLNESVGAGYIDRNWPPALKGSGAWPLTSLRQSFLNGSLTRLMDPDAVLRNKIMEFVGKGDFGLASGQKPDGTYERTYYREMIAPEDVSFESGVFLLTKEKARALKEIPEPQTTPETEPAPPFEPRTGGKPAPEPITEVPAPAQIGTVHLAGEIPPELWNRFGTKILPKLRSGADLRVGIDISITLPNSFNKNIKSELKQILDDLGLSDKIHIEDSLSK